MAIMSEGHQSLNPKHVQTHVVLFEIEGRLT